MGIILDTSVLVRAERSRWNAKRALEEIGGLFPGQELAISCITVAELQHGVERAQSAFHAEVRHRFLEDILSAVAVHDVTVQVARQAGRIDSRLARSGMEIGFEDLLIGTTALSLEYAVVTINAKHFERIEGLRVLAL